MATRKKFAVNRGRQVLIVTGEGEARKRHFFGRGQEDELARHLTSEELDELAARGIVTLGSDAAEAVATEVADEPDAD